MVSGEKNVEFREQSKWIESRLIGKQYDRVRFTNGYGATRPRFSVSFKGFKLAPKGVYKTYSNGLEVDTRGRPTYVISLGSDVRVEQVP